MRGLCVLQTDLQCKPSMLGQQCAHESAGFEGHHAAQNVTTLDINQTSSSQLAFRNAIQGHQGELRNTDIVSFLLLLLLLMETYYLENLLV